MFMGNLSFYCLRMLVYISDFKEVVLTVNAALECVVNFYFCRRILDVFSPA